VEHEALDYVEFCYRLRPRHRLASEASRFRAILGATRLYAPGHALLAVPLAVSPSLALSVRVVPATTTHSTWSLRSSLPLDGSPQRLRQWSEASFLAGPWVEGSAGTADRTTRVYVDPALPVDPAQLAARVDDVVASQHDLLGLRIAQTTTVVVLRRDDDPTAMTGNGREGGFVLELGDDVDLASHELVELIAHENLHRLIGHTLIFADTEELATLWFREGLTDFLAVRLAVAAGLLPPHRLFLRIGSALTHYRGNPAASTDGGAVSAEAYWESRDLRRLPYDKGTLLALLMDMELRNADAGDVAGWVAFLRDDASARTLPLTNAALRDALERYSGRSWTDFWAQHVTGAEPLPVHDALRSAGIEVVERLQPAPWFGLRVGATTEGRYFVASVAPDSPADLAGLRTGQTLASEPWIPTEPGGGSARLLVGEDDRSARTVVVPPGRGQRRAYVLRAVDDSDDYLARFGIAPPGAP
jgi:predicted metalloprotease with PDZ domain